MCKSLAGMRCRALQASMVYRGGPRWGPAWSSPGLECMPTYPGTWVRGDSKVLLGHEELGRSARAGRSGLGGFDSGPCRFRGVASRWCWLQRLDLVGWRFSRYTR